MLTGMRLEEYGKFRGTELTFGPVTLVCGDNEAGKSTVFDALVEVFTSPSGASREGRRLKERYGEGRKVVPIFEGKAFSFECGEFLSLYAFRPGDLSIEMDERSEWMGRVKARLFSGGVDPNTIAQELYRRADSRRTLRHNRALEELEKECRQAEAELEEHRARRESILFEEKRVRATATKLEELRGAVGEGERRLQELEERLGREQKIGRRRRMDESLELLEECERLRTEAGELTLFGEDHSSELAGIEHTLEEIRTELRINERSAGESAGRCERARTALRDAQEKLPTAQEQADTAYRLLDKVSDFLAHPPVKARHSWRISLLVLGAVALAAGVLAGVLSRGMVLRVLGPVAGSLLLAGTIVAARRTVHTPDEDARREVLGSLRDQWRGAHGAEDIAGWETLEGIQSFFRRKCGDRSELGAELARLEKALREAEDRIREDENRRVELEQRFREAQERRRRWLGQYGVAGRDEYVASLARAAQCVERLRAAEGRLERRVREEECASAEELRRHCDRVLRELDEQGVPRSGASEAEVVSLGREIERQRSGVDRLREEMGAMRAELEGAKGLMRGSLQDLPEKILGAEERIRHFRRRIEENKVEREAAALAGELFSGIAGDDDTAFTELGRDFSARFSEIVVGQREVQVRGLEGGAIVLADAGGTLRSLDALSSGTRECFVLGARLALAQRTARSGGILVLDEPFLALDDERRSRAIAVLRRFRQDTGWQIVVLTKERGLVHLVTNVFGESDVAVNRLHVGS